MIMPFNFAHRVAGRFRRELLSRRLAVLGEGTGFVPGCAVEGGEFIRIGKGCFFGTSDQALELYRSAVGGGCA